MSKETEKYTYNEFVKDIDLITEQIRSDKDWKPDYIVGVVRGGSIPAVFLSHRLGVPVVMLQWSERDYAEMNSNVCDANYWIPKEIAAGKKILLVDDIIDEGITVKKILESWQRDADTSFKGFENVRVASLIYNISQMNAIAYYYGTYIDRKKDKQWFEFFWEDKFVDRDA